MIRKNNLHNATFLYNQYGNNKGILYKIMMWKWQKIFMKF